MIETYRRKKAAGEVIELPVNGEEVAGVDEVDDLKSTRSTDSLHSSESSGSTESVISTMEEPVDIPSIPQPQIQSRIPSITASSLISVPNPTRPPVRKLPSGLGASITGKGVARGVGAVEEKMPPLGEAGMNVPRRTRR